MAKIKTLKDNNNETIYPQTVGEAIVDNTIPGSKIEDLTITGDKISNNTITSQKLNFDHLTSVERLGTYLYKVSFNSLPEDNGTDYSFGGCTSYVANGKLYRNLDWNYDETVSFIVNADGFTGMAFVNGLTRNNLDVEKINQLPYHMVDGVNDSGIMMAVHVLYNDWSWTKASANADIPLNVVGLRLLQNVKSMSDLDDFADDTLQYVKATPAMISSGYILQFIVSDGTTTKIITPPTADNQPYTVVDAPDTVAKLTNFKWIDAPTVSREYIPQDRPTGVERWNLITTEIASDYRGNMEDLRFTKAYESSSYLSEFIGINGTTKDSSDSELTAIYNSARALYNRHVRDGQTWQTMHSVIYSPNGMEELYVQENWDKNYLAIKAEIVDGSVTTPKLADSAVTTAKVANNAITNDKVEKPATGRYFNGIPAVSTDGVIEIGKHIDMHDSNTTTSDYNTRLTSNAGTLQVNGSNVLTMGNFPKQVAASNYAATRLGTSFATICTANVSSFPNNSVLLAISRVQIESNGTLAAGITRIGTDGGAFGTAGTWGITVTNFRVFTKSSSLTSIPLQIRTDNASAVVNSTGADLLVFRIA